MHYIKRHIKQLLPTRKQKGSDNILVVQSGYEVDHLLKHFKDATPVIAKKIEKKSTEFDDESFHHILDNRNDMISLVCGSFAENFKEALFQYYKKEVINIKHYYEQIKQYVELTKPFVALYAAGSLRIQEFIYANVLMDRKIPIYYMQHSGTEVLIENKPFRKFVNGNNSVKKTVVTCTENDTKVLNQCGNTKAWTGGYQKGVNVASYFNKIHFKSKKILYLTSWYHSNQILCLRNDDSDDVSYHKHLQFLNITRDLGLTVDIKLFPSEEQAHIDYFYDLLKSTDSRHVNIICNPRAEYLIPKYSAIVTESISSTLSSYLFASTKPVIYYLKNQYYFAEKTYDSFSHSQYIAQNEIELKEMLEAYKRNLLPPKCTPESIDRFLSPNSIVDPTRFIANKMLEESRQQKNLSLGISNE
jgi:hypothetical protein